MQKQLEDTKREMAAYEAHLSQIEWQLQREIELHRQTKEKFGDFVDKYCTAATTFKEELNLRP